MKRILFLSIFSFWGVNAAFAGYLTIESQSTFQTSMVEGQALKLSGFYEIANKGNEVAKNVFPTLRLGSWEWAGVAKDLAPNRAERWSVDFKITLDKVGSFTAGQLPLVVVKNYQDLNGYQFSAVEILAVGAGQLSEEQQGILRVPRIRHNFACNGNGQQFDCVVSMTNLSPEKITASITPFASNELDVLADRPNVDIPGDNKPVTATVKVKNVAGIAGSSYIVYAVLQWVENGMHRMLSVPVTITIAKSKPFSLYLYGCLAVAVIIYLTVYLSGKVKNKS